MIALCGDLGESRVQGVQGQIPASFRVKGNRGGGSRAAVCCLDIGGKGCRRFAAVASGQDVVDYSCNRVNRRTNFGSEWLKKIDIVYKDRDRDRGKDIRNSVREK